VVHRRNHSQGRYGSLLKQNSHPIAAAGIVPSTHLDREAAAWRAELVGAACSWLILLGGIVTIGVALYMVVTCYTSLPWSDGWTQIFAAAEGRRPFSLSWLWQQHNEHRLLIPKLFLGLDLRLFAATQKLLLAAIFTTQLLLLGLLSWSMRALGGWRGALWRTATGLAAFCLFSPTQWENLTWGFQLCFVLPGLFATLSFVGLLLYWRQASPSSGWKFVFLSLAAALAGMCSLANGLLLAPLLAAAALRLRLQRRVAVTYATTAVVTTLLYFHGYKRPLQNSNPVVSLHSPLKLLAYIATYFGSSWGYGSSWTHHNLQIALYAGLAGLGIAIFFLVRYRCRMETSQAFTVQLLLLLLFCLGTAFLTALGRLASGDSQAFASRYQTVALLFWWCLGCLLMSAAIGSSRRLALPAMQVLLAGVLLRGADLARFPLRDAREHAFQQRAAAAALLSAVYDREQIARAFYLPDAVWDAVPYMRTRRLSIFAEDSRPGLGTPIDVWTQMAAQGQCQSAVQSVSYISSEDGAGLRVTGWAWDLTRRKPPSYIAVVANGRIVGLGAMGDWRPMVRAAHPYMKTSFIGFTAYAKGVGPATSISLYAVLDAGRRLACPIEF